MPLWHPPPLPQVAPPIGASPNSGLSPGITYASPNIPFYTSGTAVIPPNLVVSTLTASVGITTASLGATSITTGSISSISQAVSGSINLDGNILTTSSGIGAELLLNGIPIATTSNISSITDWSLYPAVSTINADGFHLINLSTLSGVVGQPLDILAPSVSFGASGALTGVSTINGVPPGTGNVASWASFPALSDVNINSSNLNSVNQVNLNTGGNAVMLTAGSGNILNVNGSPVGGTTNTISGADTFMTASGLGTGSFNVSAISASGGLGGQVSISASPGDVGANSGQVSITANGGSAPAGLFGQVSIIANQGVSDPGTGPITTGGYINIQANSGGLTSPTLTSRIDLNAGGLNLYAGINSPITSVEGYAFINGAGGVSLVAGTWTSAFQEPGTVYLYGLTGVVVGSDLYATDIYPYWNGLAPPANLSINGRTTLSGSAYVELNNVSTINFEVGQAGAITGLSTINGSAYPPVSGGVASLNSITGAVNLVAGTGVSLSPGSPTAQDISISVSPVYQATYYKSVQQSLVNPNTDITFDLTGSWNNDGGYITHTPGSANFTVVQTGLYSLEFNVSIDANGATWNTGVNKVVSIDITRPTITEQAVIQNSALQANSTSYQQAVATSYYLVAGDVINFRTTLAFATATPFVVPVQNTFDLNTFVSWQFISLGGATAYQNPPPVIQSATTTALIPSSANTTYILTGGTTQNFTTAGLGAGNAGAVWYVKNASSGDKTIQHNGTNITGNTSTAHQGTGATNSSSQIIYWNGTDLIMY